MNITESGILPAPRTARKPIIKPGEFIIPVPEEKKMARIFAPLEINFCEEQILDIIKRHGRPIYAHQIAHNISFEVSCMYKRLRSMVKRGKIILRMVNKKSGVYWIKN